MPLSAKNTAPVRLDASFYAWLQPLPSPIMELKKIERYGPTNNILSFPQRVGRKISVRQGEPPRRLPLDCARRSIPSLDHSGSGASLI
jgi:hypothetical protein